MYIIEIIPSGNKDIRIINNTYEENVNGHT